MLAKTGNHPSVVIDRRDWLRVGAGLAVAETSLGRLWGRDSEQAQIPAVPIDERKTARSCILVYLLGGPPQLDMWDLKPDAAAEVRGPFSPISTSLPGVQICEHLPCLAQLTDDYAIVRSVSHRNNNHTPMIYFTLTGREVAQPNRDNDVRPPQRNDFPHVGAIMSQFRPTAGSLPGFIAVPEVAVRSSADNKRARQLLRGGGAGFLGTRHDPLPINGEPGLVDSIPSLALPDDVSAERFERRAVLQSLLDGGAVRSGSAKQFDTTYQQAIALTGSTHRGDAKVFSLDDEPPRVQELYGRHRLGKSLLLARRLAEAGVPMIAIHFNEMTRCDGWDTHKKNFHALETELLPLLDQGLSALLTDLKQRGTLDETLVVCMGEFGRTPKINKNAGRDHWGSCSTAVLAGGGIRGGQVLGASDKIGAYPRDTPIDPVDIHATMFRLMGLDPHQTMSDRSGRPWPLSTGQVVSKLL